MTIREMALEIQKLTGAATPPKPKDKAAAEQLLEKARAAAPKVAPKVAQSGKPAAGVRPLHAKRFELLDGNSKKLESFARAGRGIIECWAAEGERVMTGAEIETMLERHRAKYCAEVRQTMLRVFQDYVARWVRAGVIRRLPKEAA